MLQPELVEVHDFGAVFRGEVSFFTNKKKGGIILRKRVSFFRKKSINPKLTRIVFDNMATIETHF